MNALTEELCLEWLRSRNIVVDPYSSNHTNKHRLEHFRQFRIPAGGFDFGFILRSLLESPDPFGSALLHLTDWDHYTPSQMESVMQMRRNHGELRPLVEAPGQVFQPQEVDFLAGLLSIITFYQWTAYLYLDNDLILLSWEGEILDVWSNDGAQFEAIGRCLKGHEMP